MRLKSGMELKIHPAAELFPLMAEGELAELVANIEKDGLLFPITLWKKTGELLDGRNRCAACKIAEIQPPITYYEGDDPVGFILSANIHRRHLTAAQKRVELLKIDPEKSDRQIAAETKVDHKTVAKQRRKAERRGEIPHVTKRTDTKGRSQPVIKATIAKARPDFDALRARPRLPRTVYGLHELDNAAEPTIEPAEPAAVDAGLGILDRLGPIEFTPQAVRDAGSLCETQVQQAIKDAVGNMLKAGAEREDINGLFCDLKRLVHEAYLDALNKVCAGAKS